MNAPDRAALLAAKEETFRTEQLAHSITGRTLRTSDSTARRISALLLIAGLGGFVWWGFSAPIDQAVPANGVVVVSDYRKTVQSPAQGIVAKLSVREGDTVKAGQELLLLDAVQASADLELARTQWFTARATEARLRAERAQRADIAFPADLSAAAGDPRAAAAMAQQTGLLRTRRAALESELATIAQARQTLDAQIQGTTAVLATRGEQLALIEEQLGNETRLVELGYLPRNRMLEQQRNAAQLRLASADDRASIARLRSQSLEQAARMTQRRQEFLRDVDRDLAETQRDAEALQRRIDGLQVAMRDTTVRAPVAGRVVGLSMHTVGGVLQAGAAIMDIVPVGEPLRIDAQVPPDAIDRVAPGGTVDILFTAFNQATTPRVPGTVKSVAADVLVDAATKLPFYKVLIEVTPEGERALQGLDLRAGMPAQVFIVTGERTFFDYLMRPATDRMRAAFTER
jgi:protease secretion system membrane fusion protein